MLTMKYPYEKPDGTVAGIIGVSRDVTDRVNVLERMRQSESLLRLVLDALPIGVVVVELASFVRIDPFQIEQIVLNLAVNARDAMPDGGELLIKTGVVDVPDAGRFARLEVCDTGTGMDAATRARIFEPFYTTKDRGRGTGLGLATVSGIVKQNGGTVSVRSDPGHGTTFAIDLPVAAATDAEVAGAEASDAAKLCGTERILLVEDSTPVRVAVRAILERLGYAVTDVGDAAAALATIAGAKTPVDLVLIDVVLPSLGGPELAAAIVELRRDVRVLFMSGYSDDELPKRDRPASTSPILAKPFTAEVLARAVRDALDGRAHA
jgi:CheY-like chemotaxis protein